MLWGFSLGATLNGLLIMSVEPGLTCSVLVAPVTQLDRAVRELPFLAPVRKNLSFVADQVAQLNLVNFEPRPSPENILIVQARHDLYVPADSVEQLWLAWGCPEMWRVEHGHISAPCSPAVMRRIVRWAAQKLLIQDQRVGATASQLARSRPLQSLLSWIRIHPVAVGTAAVVMLLVFAVQLLIP